MSKSHPTIPFFLLVLGAGSSAALLEWPSRPLRAESRTSEMATAELSAQSGIRPSAPINLRIIRGPSDIPPPTILWSADHETGDMSQWYLNGLGREINSGLATSAASTDVAHSGRYSAKLTITAPPKSAVRLFRFTKTIPEAYYSAWYYFPRVYTPTWWIVLFYKSRFSGSVDPDPFWYLKVSNRPNGTMYLGLQWWPGPWPYGTPEGPHQGEFGGRAYQQTLMDIPVGKWVHLEVYLRQSAGFTGQIIAWQDGVELFNQNNVKTRYPFEGDDWGISSYSDSISPSPATIYIDDAAISTGRLGPP